tara:strand:- start:126722 stop:126988 length:267 start_codon:yes stop_codon:yes gene_type:complete
MFSFGNKDKQKKKAEAAAQKNSAKLRAQALANSRKARDVIGEDTLDEIRAQLEGKENSPLEQARRQIDAADKNRVTDNLRYMIDEDKS